MRYIHYIVAIVLLVIITSCSKETLSKSEPLEKVTYTYDAVGSLHNECLEYIYSSLQESIMTKTKSHSNECIDYHTIAVSTISDFMDAKGLDAYISLPTTKSGDSSQTDYTAYLSDSAATYRDSLFSIIGSSATVADINSKLSSLKNDIVNNNATLSELEKAALLCSISTAISSHNYWCENYPKWCTLGLDISNHQTKAATAISGMVRDGETNRPIMGATITAIGNPDASYSDRLGEFTINATMGQNMRIEANDYYPAEYTVIATHMDIQLFKRSAWSVINDICGADAAGAMNGALAGAIAGAVAGAIAGGVGALPGYIAGAVSGAVSNGAYDSAKKGAELIP